MLTKAFGRALELCTVLADTKLGSGRSLRESLCLGRSVSLWDVVATYLLLYRFPLLFPQGADRAAWRTRLAYRLRPYRGLAARLRDAVVSGERRRAARCREWPEGRPAVLFVCFTPSFYRGVLRPVAEAIAGRGLARVVVVHDEDVGETRGDGGRVTFESVWSHRDDGARLVQRSLRRELGGVRKELFRGAQLDALEENVRNSVGEVRLKSELRWLFWREFVRLIPQIAIAEHVLARHRPAVIVSTDDADQRCRIYSLLGRALSVPTLLVQQGLATSRDYPEWRFMSFGTVAAMGESSRADMIAQGVAPDTITVTGHPGLDRCVSADPAESNRVRAELGLSDGEQVVLFASQPCYVGAFETPRRRTEMIEAVAGAGESVRGITVVVKPHPGEGRRELRSLVRGKRHVVLVDGARDIVPLIQACDVFVTFFSTSALQALYAAKPVITLDVAGRAGSRLFVESEATWVARSRDDLLAHLRALTSDRRSEHLRGKEEARRRLLRDVTYRADGGATDRVVRIVSDLIGAA